VTTAGFYNLKGHQIQSFFGEDKRKRNIIDLFGF